MILLSTYEREIINNVGDLKNKKVVGLDEIEAKNLEIHCCRYSCAIRYIINLSFDKGIFPTALKNVTPIYKKGDKTSVGNYRPVSLTTHLSKLVEKL